MDREELINQQLEVVNAAILIDDVIGGDRSEVYVEYKGRSSRFDVNEILGSNINKWIENLPMITITEIVEVMNKHNVTLEKTSEILKDEELMKINDVEKWVKVYNNQDAFLPTDVIDRMVEVNL
ncbi:hypothetical protein Q6A90_07420 [Aliarcobacter skirrowii]|uniref:hypothetical protein n=1 Tax=Aliarcobacter skirrowii TaxID=28200 RepID=UPI0029AA9E51|nr:hypothetical protein [Aliarcobacter skirrowii]MDX4062197.1 hypothetical protein [Aliarcobacter skirrowii]